MGAFANGKPVPDALIERFKGELPRFSVTETVMSGLKVNWKPYVPFIPRRANASE